MAATGQPRQDTLEPLLTQLVRLGFSRYEARLYAGLVTEHDALTGYALAKKTGVPHAKVYENLANLVERGAVFKVADEPARYRALPAGQLLNDLETDFRGRLDGARAELEKLNAPAATEQPETLLSYSSWDDIRERARRAIAAAGTKIYLSGRTEELKALSDAVAEASARGVAFVVVHFGPQPFSRLRGRAVRHGSTEGVIYRRHQARHLALVADSRTAVWAVARDGRSWQALYGENPTFALAIKAYIRHDIYVQRIYSDIPDQLRALYGEGLDRLGEMLGPPEPHADTGRSGKEVV